MAKGRSPSDSSGRTLEYKASKHAEFLRDLEDWIDEAVLTNGQNDGRMTIASLRDSYTRDMQANIEFHEEMARNAKENREDDLFLSHSLMARIYRSLLPAERAGISVANLRNQ